MVAECCERPVGAVAEQAVEPLHVAVMGVVVPMVPDGSGLIA